MSTGEAPLPVQFGILAVILLALYGFVELTSGPSEEQLRAQYFQWFREAYSCQDHGELIICRYP